MVPQAVPQPAWLPDECIASLGSDTGGVSPSTGSVLWLCRFKTDIWFGVSRYGLVAYASSLDQIGPVAKTVKDTATVFECHRRA